MLKPGDEVGSWVVERPLGDGGFASVWLVRHRILHSLHALKLLDPQWLVHEKMRERFLSEGRILAQLRHPNLVAVTDVLFEYPERVGLVMEFVQGKPLDRMIEAGPIPRDLALEILAGVLAGIAHAHGRGVVHRDLKPPNIIVVDDQGRPRPVILDFGIAKVLDDAELMASGSSKTRVAARMGTPEYMSPEQIASSANVDGRSDVWALGVILHEMLVGTPPFAAQTPDAIYQAVLTTTYEPDPGFDPAVAKVLRGSIQRDPANRFASAKEMLQAVLEAQGVDPVVAARTASTSAPGRSRAQGTMTAADLDRRTQPEPEPAPTARVATVAAPEPPVHATLPVPPPSDDQKRTATIAATPAPPPREGRSLLIGAMGGALISALLLCTGVTTLGWAWSAGLIGGRATTPQPPPDVPTQTPAAPLPTTADPSPTPPVNVPSGTDGPTEPPSPVAPTAPTPAAPIEVKPTPSQRPTPVTPTPVTPTAPTTPTTPVTPSPVTPAVTDTKIIEDAWARYSGSLRACTRNAGPPRASTWKIKLDIKADGRLRSAEANGSPPDADLKSCLESTLRTKVAFGPLQAPQQRVFSLTLPPRGAPPARPPPSDPMNLHDLLTTRRTIHQFTPDPVDPSALDRALAAAHHAPCHRLTWPWRFFIVGPETRAQLVPIAIAEKERRAPTSEAQRRGITSGIMTPGALIAVACLNAEKPDTHHENLLATAAAIQNLMLSAHADGYGTKWSTGGVTRAPDTAALLGLDPALSTVVGFVWMGKALDVPSITRPTWQSLTTRLA